MIVFSRHSIKRWEKKSIDFVLWLRELEMRCWLPALNPATSYQTICCHLRKPRLYNLGEIGIISAFNFSWKEDPLMCIDFVVSLPTFDESSLPHSYWLPFHIVLKMLPPIFPHKCWVKFIILEVNLVCMKVCLWVNSPSRFK